MTLKEFSIALGFHKWCILDPSTLAKKHQYDCSSWWSSISDEPVSIKNSIVSIHNSSLKFLAKWLAMVVNPRADLLLCSLLELQYLYAMVNKIRCSPVRSMIALWQKMISSKSPHRYDLSSHSHCEIYRCDGKCWSHLLSRNGGVQIRGRSQAFCARAHDARGAQELYLYVLPQVW